MARSRSHILVWALIAGAFIGPGTVATATRAGAEGGLALLPVVAVAALAGYLFMEMAGRVVWVSGRSLGQLLGGSAVGAVLFAAVALGCLAYQAGNLLGALGGLQLLLPGLPRATVLMLVVLVGALLWWGATGRLGRYMAVVVAGMGLLFLVVAAITLFDSDTPSPLKGAGAVAGAMHNRTALALVGTTIVPYNFFLAAGLAAGGSLTDLRRGLQLSFGVGGLVTASILVVGSTAVTFTGFGDLATTLSSSVGGLGPLAIGIGLFAAGISSATTAPLAAAVAGRELLAGTGDARWARQGALYRATWLAVLGVGAAVTLLDLDIIDLIVAAQFVNGLLLPLVAAAMLWLANRRALLGGHTNRWWENVVGVVVVGYLVWVGF